MKNLILFTVIGLLLLTGCGSWEGQLNDRMDQTSNDYSENFYRRNLDQYYDQYEPLDDEDYYMLNFRDPYWSLMLGKSYYYYRYFHNNK